MIRNKMCIKNNDFIMDSWKLKSLCKGRGFAKREQGRKMNVIRLIGSTTYVTTTKYHEGQFTLNKYTCKKLNEKS